MMRLGGGEGVGGTGDSAQADQLSGTGKRGGSQPTLEIGGEGRASTRGKRVSARSEALGWKEWWWSSEAAVKPDTGTSRGRSEKPENRFYLKSGGRGEDGGENTSEEESKWRTANTSYPVWLHTGTVRPISLSAHRYLLVAEAGLIERTGEVLGPSGQAGFRGGLVPSLLRQGLLVLYFVLP
ncbi:uncharacterized protein BO80DRAFT_20092 [Aspergillus ibericus CBS 121593]|uniref:Uncharacterized protein n=1 Tax=Aspergillus ibericus CBS 121593 TaxID=1448316 RepID=A0A395H5E0_9EURO|nr:hypothetical protein BO80DRAFT_20092 [Aspergillus ibericus CBS 121593]RAL02896.1 hypothetical protein BO80DRAFT_20092 [Aspergillus ibericus CBS 121593]